MKLEKQLRQISWGTAIKVFVDNMCVYKGDAKTSLQNGLVRGFLDAPIKTVKLDKADDEAFILIKVNGGKKHEG